MHILLKIGDYARHRVTGNVGKVVAYGHQIVDGVYLPTLTVEIRSIHERVLQKRTFIEDMFQEWIPIEEGYHPDDQTETNLAIASS